MLEIYPYDAGRGDCLRIRFCDEKGAYRNILVDSGTRRFGRSYVSIFQDIQRAGESVDIQLITHTDEDHLGGLLYMVNHEIPIQDGVVVMNCPQNLPAPSSGDTPLSVPQANQIISRLGTQKTNMRSGLRGDTLDWDGVHIQILYPTRGQVEAVFNTVSPNTPLGIRDDRILSLEQLMEQPLSYRDTSLSNRASIVFVLEYARRRLLFTGDSWSADILESVCTYAKVRGKELPIHFDAVKLPHHGSAGNISEEWPKVFHAQQYILCADGRSHPSKHTIAKLLNWYGDVEIVSPRDWWNSGYFSDKDIAQFIESKRLQLTLKKGVPMSW